MGIVYHPFTRISKNIISLHNIRHPSIHGLDVYELTLSLGLLVNHIFSSFLQLIRQKTLSVSCSTCITVRWPHLHRNKNTNPFVSKEPSHDSRHAFYNHDLVVMRNCLAWEGSQESLASNKMTKVNSIHYSLSQIRQQKTNYIDNRIIILAQVNPFMSTNVLQRHYLQAPTSLFSDIKTSIYCEDKVPTFLGKQFLKKTASRKLIVDTRII